MSDDEQDFAPEEEPGDGSREPPEAATKPWQPPLGTPESRWQIAAYGRLQDLEAMLYHLYIQRGVSDPKLYPIPPEALEPDWIGPEEDGFPALRDGLIIAEIGRLIAAMGGYLELRAIFPDTTITLMAEPGPEHLYDHE
jgi:hypothetical protein